MLEGHLTLLVGFLNCLMLEFFRTQRPADVPDHWIIISLSGRLLIFPTTCYQPLVSQIQIALQVPSLSFRCPSAHWIPLPRKVLELKPACRYSEQYLLPAPK